MSRLRSILIGISWIIYPGFFGYRLWITANEIEELNPDVPLDQVKEIALMNRSAIYVLLLIIWIVPAVISLIRSSSRLRKIPVVRRMMSIRRWGWALRTAHPVVHLGWICILPLFLHLELEVVWVIPVAALLYLLSAFIRILLPGKEPDSESRMSHGQ